MRKAKNPNYVTFGSQETIVTFTKDRGELRTNDAGEFFYREMPDGKFTCASPDLERRLIDLGYRAGEQVGITREPYGRSVIWKVRRIGEPVAEMPRPLTTTKKLAARPSAFPERLYASFERAPESTAPRIAATGSPEKLRGGSEDATHSASAAKEPKAPPPITFPECEPINAQPAASNARDGQAVNLARPAAIEGARAAIKDGIRQAFFDAVDVARDVQAYAAQFGMHFTFGAAEIQDIGSTIAIQEGKQANINLMNRNRELRANGGADPWRH